MMLHTYKAVVLKEPFNEDMILSINPKCDKIEQLKIELSSPIGQLSIRGLVKVESKKDLAKRHTVTKYCRCFYNGFCRI